MSGGCQIRRDVPQRAVSRCSNMSAEASLLDHLVGKREQHGRNVEAERLRGLEIERKRDPADVEVHNWHFASENVRPTDYRQPSTISANFLRA